MSILQEIGSRYLERIGAENVLRGGGGVDIQPLIDCGVPGAGVIDDCNSNTCEGLNATYFYYHHTNADTPSISNDNELYRMSQLLATYAYIVADLDDSLPRDLFPNDIEGYYYK